MRTVVLVCLLVACTPDGQVGTCPSRGEVRRSAEVDFEHVGRLTYDEGWEGGAEVLANEAAVQAFEALTGLSLEGVDLDTHQVAALGIHVNSTCGLGVYDYSVTLVDGVPHADATFVDPSGGCRSVCDMEDAVGVVFAVEHAGPEPITACARRIDRCW